MPPVGRQHYALVVSSDTERTKPVFTTYEVPPPPVPEAARNLSAQALPAEIALAWEGPQIPGLSYNVYRAPAGSSDFAKLNAERQRVVQIEMRSEIPEEQ